MKHKDKKIYAKALFEALANDLKLADENKIINNFLNILLDHGYQNKAKKILELTEYMALEKRGNRKIVIESARKMTSEQSKMIEGIIKNGDMVENKINPELIAGLRVTINNEKQFDASLKHKLEDIFK